MKLVRTHVAGATVAAILVARAAVGQTDPGFEYVGATPYVSDGEKAVSRMFPLLPPHTTPVGATSIEGQYASLVGRTDLVAKNPDDPGTEDDSCAPTGAAVGADAALDAIVAAARGTSIVIINEHHGRPFHRAFVTDLAIRLRSEGYDYFAAETFMNAPGDAFEVSHEAQMSQPGVHENSGFYTHEPMFSREVRQVKAVGYALLEYEERMDQQPTPPPEDAAQRIASREESQSENLMEAIFRDDPDARVLIHVGFGHAAETLSANGGEMMAARLKRKVGADPLTIDQSFCTGEATQLVGPAENYAPGAFDMTIAHPVETFERSRPTWRRERGDRDIELPEAFASADAAIVVDAHVFDEPFTTEPIDRVLVLPGENLPLLLPPGRYTVSARAESGPLPEVYELVVR